MPPILRVCHIGFNFFPGQGLTILFEFPRHQAMQGLDVSVIAPGRPGEPADEHAEGINVHRIHMNSVGRYSFGRLVFLWKAAQWIRSRQFDLIHVYAFVGAGALPLLGLKRNRPIWLYDCQTSAIKRPFLALQNFLIWLESVPYDAITVLSEGIRNIVFGVRSRKVKATIPLGADFAHFAPREARRDLRERWRIPERGAVLTYCGTLDHNRHMHRLIEAFSFIAQEIPDATLLMIGDGSAVAELKDQARKLGLTNRVVFTGFIPYERIPDYLSITDIALSYIVQTPYFEHQPPTKTVEYLAQGLPVVATDTAGNREFIVDGENGLLSDDTPRSFAATIVGLHNNPEKRKALSMAARASVNKFDWANIVGTRVLPVYRELLQD